MINLWDTSDSEDEAPTETRLRRRRPRTFRERINIDPPTIFLFNEKFRMNAVQLEYILNAIGANLRSSTARNRALSPKQQLAIAVRWLGTGCQYHGVADMHGTSKATVCQVVHKCVSAINQNLFENIVKWPEDVGEVISQFHAIAGMPLLVGSIDGTLINIDAPRLNEDQFVDRHGKHSINCMAVCGPNGQFYYVSARWPGSVHDSRVLRNSELFSRMQAGWRPYPNSVLLGDSGYPLLDWLLTPTGFNLDDPAVIRYNQVHKSTRRIIENAFGILKEKFPCLNHLRVQEPRFAGEVFKCCTILCNIARTREDEEQIRELQHNQEEELVNAGSVGNNHRRLLEMISCFRR